MAVSATDSAASCTPPTDAVIPTAEVADLPPRDLALPSTHDSAPYFAPNMLLNVSIAVAVIAVLAWA